AGHELGGGSGEWAGGDRAVSPASSGRHADGLTDAGDERHGGDGGDSQGVSGSAHHHCDDVRGGCGEGDETGRSGLPAEDRAAQGTTGGDTGGLGREIEGATDGHGYTRVGETGTMRRRAGPGAGVDPWRVRVESGAGSEPVRAHVVEVSRRV